MSTPAKTTGAPKPALLPKRCEIDVTNPRTKETVLFLGQGIRVSEAVKDGAGALDHKVAVRLPSGVQKLRLLFRFEEDIAFQSDAAEQAAEEAWLAEKRRKKEEEEKKTLAERRKLMRWLQGGDDALQSNTREK
jgi:hypothetical protein